MKKYFVLLLVIVGINSCSIMQMIMPHEQIAGVEIVSVEDIENNDGDIQREVKGVIPAPFDTDEEWYVAFQAIYSQKKVPGKDTVIKIYLEDREQVGRVAGLSYGLDLLGACLGSFLAAAFLVPVLGIFQTCFMAALINLAVLGILSCRDCK